MEAPIRFELMNKAFAEPSLNRLGREPLGYCSMLPETCQ
jgi:hypothetical protein